MEINKINGTVGKSLINYKDQLNECYSRRGNLIAYVQNIFDVENINNNPYTIEVINNLKTKNLDEQIMYLYNIIAAGYNLKTC